MPNPQAIIYDGIDASRPNLNRPMNEVIIRHRPKFLHQLTTEQLNNEHKFRGSKYHGVSLNGKNNSYQILTMIQEGKAYLATVDNIDYAAVLYDILSI